METKSTDMDGMVTFGFPAPSSNIVKLPDSMPYGGPGLGFDQPFGVTPGSYTTLDTPLTNTAPANGTIRGNDIANTPVSGSIVGIVWLDNDEDGQAGTLDRGMADVVVHLRTTNGTTVLQTTTTNTFGWYSFSVKITGATYTVIVDNPNPNYFAFLNTTSHQNTVNNYGGGEVDVGPGGIQGIVNAGMQAKPGVKKTMFGWQAWNCMSHSCLFAWCT